LIVLCLGLILLNEPSAFFELLFDLFFNLFVSEELENFLFIILGPLYDREKKNHAKE
jgi:hypothetical protein